VITTAITPEQLERREQFENRTGAGFCPRCLVGIEWHPLDDDGVDVAYCPSARTALDLVWDAQPTPVSLLQAMVKAWDQRHVKPEWTDGVNAAADAARRYLDAQ